MLVYWRVNLLKPLGLPIFLLRKSCGLLVFGFFGGRKNDTSSASLFGSLKGKKINLYGLNHFGWIFFFRFVPLPRIFQGSRHFLQVTSQTSWGGDRFCMPTSTTSTASRWVFHGWNGGRRKAHKETDVAPFFALSFCGPGNPKLAYSDYKAMKISILKGL